MSEAHRWTMAEIREASTGHFFDRKTMRAHGDTMRSFAVENRGEPDAAGLVTFRRVRPMRARDGASMGGVGSLYHFDPRTGRIWSAARS